ncbi:hypothetical protein [Enterovibrio norvegicus]|uniref:hypothetical protein n=1 Tax=Enterovibrio norvegicus TaxID=188144 RepID=UPI00352EE8B5
MNEQLSLKITSVLSTQEKQLIATRIRTAYLAFFRRDIMRSGMSCLKHLAGIESGMINVGNIEPLRGMSPRKSIDLNVIGSEQKLEFRDALFDHFTMTCVLAIKSVVGGKCIITASFHEDHWCRARRTVLKMWPLVPFDETECEIGFSPNDGRRQLLIKFDECYDSYFNGREEPLDGLFRSRALELYLRVAAIDACKHDSSFEVELNNSYYEIATAVFTSGSIEELHDCLIELISAPFDINDLKL